MSEFALQVLTYGLLSAAFLRLSLIVIGAELVTNFQPVLLAFGGLLLYSSYGLLTKGKEDEEPDLSDNQIVKACRCDCAHASIMQYPPGTEKGEARGRGLGSGLGDYTIFPPVMEKRNRHTSEVGWSVIVSKTL